MNSITMAELRAFYPALAWVAEASLRNPLDPETAQWLDGPSFVRWLRANGLQRLDQFGSTPERQLNRWSNGLAVSLQAADEMCVRISRHINEIPPEVWRHKPPMRGEEPRRATPDERAAAVEAYREGKTLAEVAADFGVDPRTIRNWVRAA